VPAYPAKTTERLLGELWISADLPNFNSLDFSTPCVLHAKVQATTHSNLAALCPSSTVEWDWLAVVYTGSASYFWTTFKWPEGGLYIFYEFFAFQTEYSLATAEAETQLEGPVAPTIQQWEMNRATIICRLCAGKPLWEAIKSHKIKRITVFSKDLDFQLSRLDSIGLFCVWRP
jgi:hypothetical protein